MDENERAKLWKAYHLQRTAAIREKIIIEYASLVNIVAGKLSMYLGYNVEYDDLVGYGIFGLIDAIDKFDYCKGIKFETYASLRIRGSILDHIRKMDWIPRSVRQKQKRIDVALTKLENELGRIPTDIELSVELGISEEECITWLGQTKISSVASLEDFMEQGAEIHLDDSTSADLAQPEQIVIAQELNELLAQSLEHLTEKEKKVILLYYYEELTLKEISYILEVSESRVSQLHTKALQRMKGKLGTHMELFKG